MSKANQPTKYAVALSTVSAMFVTMAGSASAQSLADAFPSGGFLDQGLNIGSLIVAAFSLLLAAAVLWVIYNIVVAGIKIAGAKEDAEKRKNGLKSIVNAGLGLVVALGAFAITTTTSTLLFGDDSTISDADEITVPCILDNGDTGKLVQGQCEPR